MTTRIRVVLSLLAIVALLVGIGFQARDLRDGRRADGRLEAAVAMAKAQVLDITTLDSDTVGPKLKAMSARTSGDFQDQVMAIASTFVKIVQQKKIKATGRIDGFGVSSSSDRDVSVLVASTAVVSEAGKTPPTTRTYRIKVALVRSGTTWKINGMEFVQ